MFFLIFTNISIIDENGAAKMPPLTIISFT